MLIRFAKNAKMTVRVIHRLGRIRSQFFSSLSNIFLGTVLITRKAVAAFSMMQKCLKITIGYASIPLHQTVVNLCIRCKIIFPKRCSMCYTLILFYKQRFISNDFPTSLFSKNFKQLTRLFLKN